MPFNTFLPFLSIIKILEEMNMIFAHPTLSLDQAADDNEYGDEWQNCPPHFKDRFPRKKTRNIKIQKGWRVSEERDPQMSPFRFSKSRWTSREENGQPRSKDRVDVLKKGSGRVVYPLSFCTTSRLTYSIYDFGFQPCASLSREVNWEDALQWSESILFFIPSPSTYLWKGFFKLLSPIVPPSL